VITYSSGLVSAFDVRAGFTWLGDIEKEVPKVGGFTLSGLSKVFERNDLNSDIYSISN
jgi:hypothetical protein